MTLEANAGGEVPCTFVEPRPGEALFVTARELGDANRKYVGQLTFDAWRDYAEGGHILAAVIPSQDGAHDAAPTLLGYAAYRTPRNEVVLAHLVVHLQARHRGVARLLVERLSAMFPERRGIGAKCRADFPANAIWPRLGFVPLGSMPGRGCEGQPLTYWWRDHGHADLMTWSGPPSSAMPVVMDANVFIDLHGREPGVEASRTRQLLTEVLGDRLELLVTPEMYNEINRRGDIKDRDRLRNVIATQYPRLPVHAQSVDQQVQALIEAIGHQPRSPQDRSDLNHIAYASAAGVPTVVTRDNPVLRRLRPIAAGSAGVGVVSPEELVALVDEAEAAPAYMPAALLGTGYNVKEAGAGDNALLRQFFSTASGEKLKAFERALRALAATRPSSSRLLITDPYGAPVALIGLAPESDVLTVPIVRMIRTALQATLAAQVASLLRSCAADRGVHAIGVSDQYANPLVLDALLRDGFYLTDGGPLALTLPAVCRMTDLSVAIRDALPEVAKEREESSPWLTASQSLVDAPSAHVALALERQLRPLCIIDAPVDVWMVPIRSQFSAPLFGYPQELLERPDRLGISVEHVYYRGGRSGERAPARVIWYVSGEREGVVMGRSELVEVIDGPWEAIYSRFRRLGVYKRDQVKATAGSGGQVRALRVINTDVFRRPLPLRTLRRFAQELGVGLQLQSPSRVSPELFALIMEGAR